MIFKSRYDRPIKTCFYDGSEESTKFIVENFRDFSYIMWTEQTVERVKSKQLVYYCEDGEYQNVVPPNHYIIQYQMSVKCLTITDWLDEDEFKNNFKIENDT